MSVYRIHQVGPIDPNQFKHCCKCNVILRAQRDIDRLTCAPCRLKELANLTNQHIIATHDNIDKMKGGD